MELVVLVLVRGHGKTSGAIRFACLFLCFFLLGKQKKESKKAVSRQKVE